MTYLLALLAGYLLRVAWERWRQWEAGPDRKMGPVEWTHFGGVEPGPWKVVHGSVPEGQMPELRTVYVTEADPPDPRTDSLQTFAARWAQEHPA